MEDRSSHPVVRLVRSYAGPYTGRYLAGFGSLLLARIPQRATPLVLGVAIDALLIGQSTYSLPFVPNTWIPTTTIGQYWFTIGLLSFAVLLRGVLDWLARVLTMTAIASTLHDVRIATYDVVLGLEMEYFDDNSTGELMSILNNDVNNLRKLVGATNQTLMFGGQTVVAFAFMAILNWQLALLLTAYPIALAIASRIYSQRLTRRYSEVRESVSSVNAHLTDTIRGISTVKAFTQEATERSRLSKYSQQYRAKNWSTIRVRLEFNGVTWLLEPLTIAPLFVLGGYWVLVGPPAFFSGSLTAGTLFTFVMYTRSFFAPVRSLAVDVIDSYEDGFASAKRVHSLLADSRTKEATNAAEIDVREGNVEYDNVSFEYDDAEVLSNVDFEVESGELVGVVGPTGAGKSTLMKLLFRFYDPSEGAIEIDGQNVRAHSVESLREGIGFVSQDPVLFGGTIRENIAYSLPEASRQEVVEAAKLAGAHEFVTDLKDGYETEVGERGEKLSGGQRQRVAIARAVLHDPSILVFDEATSHVDNETELHIKESLESIAADRTTFLVAHRLSTVRDADRILVLDDGRLVEDGTHDELLERNGTYADLWRVQVGEFDAVSDSFLADHSRIPVIEGGDR